jgi:hypothetical protein
MKLSELQSKLSLAYQMDLEHGVAWINEQETVKFAKNYPDMAEMIGIILNLETIDPEE